MLFLKGKEFPGGQTYTWNCISCFELTCGFRWSDFQAKRCAC